MPDVYSQHAFESLKFESLLSNDTTYVIRIDIPISLHSPKTEIIQSGANSPDQCLSFVDRSLAGVLNDASWNLNIQCRIWQIQESSTLQLVFDQFSIAEMIGQGLKEFASTAPRHEPIASLSTQHERMRRNLGGPYDSDHALLVAINNRNFGRRGDR